MTTITPLLPAYRLSVEDINKVIADLPENLGPPLIVLNDQNATTARYLHRLEESGRIQFLQIPYQLGKSEAVRQGLKVILQNSNVDIVAQFDGRSKQPVWQLQLLLEVLHNEKSDIVVGERYTKQFMTGQVHRKAGSGFMSMIIKSVTGYSLPDAVCGMRAYTRELANHFLQLRCFGYGLEVEQLLIASMSNCTVSSVAIESNRQADVTNAEKIEDNIYAIINYSSELNVSNIIRDTLNYMLAQIKRRSSFDVNLSVFGGDGSVRLTYTGSEDSIVDAYTDQHVRDGYIASHL